MKQVSYFGYFDPTLRRNILLTSARPPLGVTVSTTNVVVFTKVTTSARKYDSYEPPDPGAGVTVLVALALALVFSIWYFTGPVPVNRKHAVRMLAYVLQQ